ncbi:MAG: beta-propeller domain-containing protein, partial [Verrucomicrobiota bacterium]
MKRILLTSFSVLIGSIAPLDAAPLKVRSLTEQSTVSIASIHRRVVKVRVPAGFTSVTLEVCTSLKRGEWKQVATKAVPSTPGIVEFQLERAVGRRFLRVSGTTASLLPDETNQPALFLADPAATANGPFASGGTPAATTGEMLTLSSSNAAFGAGVQSDSAARAVSESDIWRLSGERLYFYNSLRGLQVFDIADPDSPAMLGQLRTHGTGDQMYLLNSGHVALMTHNSNWSGINGYTSSLIIADVSQGAPKEVARAEFNGWLRESRLVGKVLYLVSESYWSQTGGLQVTSFDLSNPEKPIKRDTLNLDSWSAVISATNRYLFVARTTSEDWTRSQIEIIDISSPVGILKKAGTIRTAGIVNDKFKMRLEGETFTVVSAIPRRWQGQTSTASRTAVETFSLKNPFSPVALGNLELGLGESVRATRFDDDRLYVVTFFTVDPLWVVDLSKPAQPKILGELTVPGFSSYIEPLGDRLVSVGQVDGKAAVSLFDVTDPTHPKTLSQLPLGEGNYSYSEANWNEKAFNVIPEENLILVPYSGYDATNGYATRVQLLDLTREKLTKRGIIDHSFAARRTAVVGDRIVAVSSTDLVTVDFADRDKPKVTSDVEIAWHVDQVFL